MTKRLILSLAMALSAACLHCAGGAEELRILYTSSLNGNLDGCSCASLPRAGLVKSAASLRRLRGGGTAFLLDAGDVFPVTGDDALAHEILGAYGDLGYDCVAVGDQEFSGGVQGILERLGKFPFLSNNLMICPTERCVPVSLAPLTLRKGPFSIGVFSLIDPSVFALHPKTLTDLLKVSPPDAAAGTAVGRLRENGVDLVVLLYHGLHENALALAARVPGIDVIILGHEQMLIDAEEAGSTVLVSPGEEGNRVGVLTVSFPQGKPRYRNSFKVSSYRDDPDDGPVRERIERYRRATILGGQYLYPEKAPP